MDRTAEFVELWTAASRQVYSYILALQPHFADAEEAFQETSRVAWEKFEEFEPGTNFVGWVCRIARYKVLSGLAAKKRSRLKFSDSFRDLIAEEVKSQEEESNRRIALQGCLRKLSARDRDLVDRRYRSGATTRSVSEEVGRSLSAVYKALNRIHETLFECIRRTIAAEQHQWD